jgi:secreted PhoX family phosphatase
MPHRRPTPFARSLDRRSFLRTAGGLIPTSALGLVAACRELDANGALGAERAQPLTRATLGNGGYGQLVEDDGILLLPEGFKAQVVRAVGDPMSDGAPTPIAFDGMAAFPAPDGRIRLVRNHEVRTRPGRAIGSRPYDPLGGGGTTTLELDADGRVVRDFVSLSGTVVNCSGGPTPWGTWLSAEEAVAGPREGFAATHGWIFEVSAAANGEVEAVPLRDMGRFSHEAVAVDARTGIVYETEDSGYPPGSGFYRFLPNSPGRLAAGGRLQVAAVPGRPGIELFRGKGDGIEVGTEFDVIWLDLDFTDPGDDRAEAERKTTLMSHAVGKGAAVFSRLEGCWFAQDTVFFHDTSGGLQGYGQVWQYVPGAAEGEGRSDDRGVLRLLFESPGADVLDGPDAIITTPRGGLLLCEDASGIPHLRGLTPTGAIFDFAQNRLSDREFAGACFSPDGQTLFVNIQGPTSGLPLDAGVKGMGVTLAIRGPWTLGAL